MSSKNIVSQLTLKEVEKIALEVVGFCQKSPSLLHDCLPNSFEILVKHGVVSGPQQEIQEKIIQKGKSVKRNQQDSEAPSIIETYLTGSEREAHINKIKDILNNVNESNSIDNQKIIELLRRVCKTKYFNESNEEEQSLIISLIKNMLINSPEIVFIRSKPSIFYVIDKFELSLSKDGELVSIKKVQQEIDPANDNSGPSDLKPDPQLFDQP